MSWTALTRDELNSMLSSALSQYDEDVRSDWERISIEPEKWQCSPWGDLGEGFWAVAIKDGNVLWYNDIEDGFNWSRYKQHGIIDEYWCNQSEFDSILEDFAQARSNQAWLDIAPGNVPAELQGPGRIRQRQTTYWELESGRGERCRVYFKDKAEFAFDGDEYQEVLLFDEHPLLLDYRQPMQTIMIAGRPRNPADVASALDDRIRAQTNGWRSLAQYANMDSAELLGEGHGVLMNAPEPVCAAVVPLLTDAGAKPYYAPGESRVLGESQRVLLLGNCYVIAEAFSFVRLSTRPTKAG